MCVAAADWAVGKHVLTATAFLAPSAHRSCILRRLCACAARRSGPAHLQFTVLHSNRQSRATCIASLARISACSKHQSYSRLWGTVLVSAVASD